MGFRAESTGSGRSEYILVGIMVAVVMVGSLFAVSEGGFLFSFDYASGASSPSASAGFSALGDLCLASWQNRTHNPRDTDNPERCQAKCLRHRQSLRRKAWPAAGPGPLRRR